MNVMTTGSWSVAAQHRPETQAHIEDGSRYYAEGRIIAALAKAYTSGASVAVAYACDEILASRGCMWEGCKDDALSEPVGTGRVDDHPFDFDLFLCDRHREAITAGIAAHTSIAVKPTPRPA